MQRTQHVIFATLLASVTLLVGTTSAEEKSTTMPFGDFKWMHGANYTPSYAATDVETWLKYDHLVIDRELGYAEKLGLNCVRVFLQSLVYDHDAQKFLADFEDFVATADSHGLKVMPIVFDSCFGVSPSLESHQVWVANPGPDRMGPENFEALDGYAQALVGRYEGDRRIALWDVMNEPTATVLAGTEEGKAEIWAFVRHYCQLIKKVDPTHAVTSGVAGTDSQPIVDLIDVLSGHSYAKSEEEFRQKLTEVKEQAEAAGKPWIVSECCAPGWGSPYEMALPVLRDFGVGHTFWEVVIGRNQFAAISGLLYPDGTARRLTSVEAVIGGPATGFVEKPDSEGVAIGSGNPALLTDWVRFAARNAVTDATWHERNTLACAIAIKGKNGPFGEDALATFQQIESARKVYQSGNKQEAFQTVQKLLRQAADGGEPDYVSVDVKRKPSDEKWTPRPTRTLEKVTGFRPQATTVKLGKYGGRTDRQVEASGFFRAAKVDDRWWLVDPEGYLWQTVGCCSVRTNPTADGQAALVERFGSPDAWPQATTDLLLAHGFNTLACWSHWGQFQETRPRLAYTTQSNFMSSYGKKRGGTYQQPGHTGYPNDCIFVFDPQFAEFCEGYAREMLAATKDDPYLLGHFSDNEMPFRQDSLDRYLSLEESDPGYQAARRWAQEHHSEASNNQYPAEDREAFLEYLAETYFRIVGRAIKAADPNHMFLGCRFHGAVLRTPSVYKGCGKYVDVVSCNYYGAWTPDAERISNWVAWSGRPVMVTEWYAKGMDSGMPNNSGAGWTVKTQADRGRFYENFTLALLEHPGCVGWHWFKYMDNDPANTRVDPSNVDSNKGIVDSRYRPYPDLLERMGQINTQVYSLIDFFETRPPSPAQP
jgi:hypothetical protein